MEDQPGFVNEDHQQDFLGNQGGDQQQEVLEDQGGDRQQEVLEEEGGDHQQEVLEEQGGDQQQEVLEDQGGVQLQEVLEDEDVIMNGEYAVVQGAFATGFSVPGRTTPGFAIRKKAVDVTFEGVHVSGGVNLVAEGLESFYDWSDIMQIIVSAVEEGGSTDDIEDKVSEELSDWLTTLAGWGLLSTLVPVEKVRHIIAALLYTNANWNESTGGPRTDLKVFEAVKYVYSHVPGKGVHDVVPRLGVWFQELRPSSKMQERKKRLVVFFKGQWDVQVKFYVEKKRAVKETLKELAFEAVAKQVWRTKHLDTKILEVADTLQDGLNTHFHDAQWVRKHWDLDMDFDTESEEDSIIEDELSGSPDEHEISQVVDGTRSQPCGLAPTKAKIDISSLIDDWSEEEEEEEPSKETQQAQGVLDGEEGAGDHPKMGELAMPPRMEMDMTWWALYLCGLLLAYLCT